MSWRARYPLLVCFNERIFRRVIIDQHYKKKHSDSVNDQLILELVSTLNGQSFTSEAKQDDYDFFKIEPVRWKNKSYRLILTLSRSDDFIGVINAFRVEEK